MADQDSERRTNKRVSVNLLVKVKHESVDDFITHFATNISGGGIFIQSRNPHPKGTIIKFEIRLKDGFTVIKGSGVVAWTRTRDAQGGKPKVPGMGVKFMELDQDSKLVVKKILNYKDDGKKAGGEDPVAAIAAAQAEAGSGPAGMTDDSLDVDVDLGDIDFDDGGDEAASLEGSPEADSGDGTDLDMDMDVDIDLGLDEDMLSAAPDGEPQAPIPSAIEDAADPMATALQQAVATQPAGVPPEDPLAAAVQQAAASQPAAPAPEPAPLLPSTPSAVSVPVNTKVSHSI